MAAASDWRQKKNRYHQVHWEFIHGLPPGQFGDLLGAATELQIGYSGSVGENIPGRAVTAGVAQPFMAVGSTLELSTNPHVVLPKGTGIEFGIFDVHSKYICAEKFEFTAVKEEAMPTPGLSSAVSS
jgi:hypothetical protein